MSRRGPKIPRRRRIFIGCEGASEQSYCALLRRLAQQAGLHVHIDPHILQPGAGDPLELVQRAVAKIRSEEHRRAPYAVKAMLLDDGEKDKCRAASRLATDAGIHLVWQRPDHEALLLRHLPECQNERPPRGTSLAALTRKWPEYEKALPMLQLARKIEVANLSAAATVEPELHSMLRLIGFDL